MDLNNNVINELIRINTNLVYAMFKLCAFRVMDDNIMIYYQVKYKIYDNLDYYSDELIVDISEYNKTLKLMRNNKIKSLLDYGKAV